MSGRKRVLDEIADAVGTTSNPNTGTTAVSPDADITALPTQSEPSAFSVNYTRFVEQLPVREAVLRGENTSITVDSLLPLSLVFLPGDKVVPIMAESMDYTTIVRYCRAERAFAYRFCGFPKTADKHYFGLEDENVEWAFWQVMLKRDFGLAVDAKECAAQAPYYRLMVADALQKYIKAELLDEEHDVASNKPKKSNAVLAVTEANRAHLLAYKSLYEMLYESNELPLSLEILAPSATMAYNFAFGLDTGVVALYIRRQHTEPHQTVILSSVAIAAASIDAALGRFDPIALSARLLAGRYGRVLILEGQWLLGRRNTLVLNRPGAPAEKAIAPHDDWPIPDWSIVDSLTPEQRFGLRRIGPLKEAALQQIPELLTAAPYLNDAGDTMLFDTVYTAQGVSERIGQLRAVSHEPTNGELLIAHRRVLDPDPDPEPDPDAPAGHRWPGKAFGPGPLSNDAEPRHALHVFDAQTEKTYTTSIDLRSAVYWRTNKAVFGISSWATSKTIFTFSIAQLIRKHALPESRLHYRVRCTAMSRKLLDGTIGTRHLFVVSQFLPETAAERAAVLAAGEQAYLDIWPFTMDRRSLYVIKVDLDSDGTVMTRKLFIIPRLLVRGVFALNVISPRHLVCRYDLGRENAIIDWRRETVYFWRPESQHPNPLIGQYDADRRYFMVPMLNLQNHKVGDPIPVPADDWRGNDETIIRDYQFAQLEPIDLPKFTDAVRIH